MKAAEAEGARGNASKRRRRVKVCWSTLTCAVLKVRGGGARKAESARSGSEERSEADRKRESAPGKVSGDDSWRAPPVPIPNTEVKPPNADGTELGTAWESRKLPGSKGEREERKFFPLSNIRKNGAASGSRASSEAEAVTKAERKSEPQAKERAVGRQASREQTPNDPQ